MIWLSFYSAQLIRNELRSPDDVGFGIALLLANLSVIGGVMVFGWFDYKKQASKATAIENLHGELVGLVKHDSTTKLNRNLQFSTPNPLPTQRP